MAPKREHDDAELSPPLPQASTKRLKLTSKNALAPSKRVSGHVIQKALAKRITSLPHELQDEILEHLLAASLPSERAELTIGDHYTTFTFPLALKINRKTRAKYVEQFFRQGQVIVVETVNDNDTAVIDRAADVVKNWLLTVDSPHQRLVTDLHTSYPSSRWERIYFRHSRLLPRF